MEFKTLSEAVLKRCEEESHPVNAWSPSDWSNAMAGMCGEVCNLTKKIRRSETVSLGEIGQKIGNLVIYADLLCQRMGLDLGTVVRRAFNEHSNKLGSNIKVE